jgi:hypothetical protein
LKTGRNIKPLVIAWPCLWHSPSIDKPGRVSEGPMLTPNYPTPLVRAQDKQILKQKALCSHSTQCCDNIVYWVHLVDWVLLFHFVSSTVLLSLHSHSSLIPAALWNCSARCAWGSPVHACATISALCTLDKSSRIRLSWGLCCSPRSWIDQVRVHTAPVC